MGLTWNTGLGQFRVNFFQRHWALLDQLLNGDSLAPRAPPNRLPITAKHGHSLYLLQHTSTREAVASAETRAYVEHLRYNSQTHHRLMNRAQSEFGVLFRLMTNSLSHIPLAHALSDLETVDELLTVVEEQVRAMRTLLNHERAARNEIDELPY